jgi:hypothetical protein
MTNTPVSSRPSYSIPLTPTQIEASERELFELLRKALEPSFVLVRRIGAGGMGIVFLARDPALKRLVAVKVMAPDRAVDDEARARFQREAEAVAKIAHPNVVAIYSVGELANGIPYLVMQYVEGRSMAERLKEEGPLEVPEAKAIIGQVASALGAAHAKGVIHRDIKAANILWDDASGRALVSDFGIASLVERESEGDPMQLTQTGVAVGTPQFMSPEQLLAERVSEKTDVYSLGLLSYELLAREGPFPHMSSPNQLIVAHLRDAPRPISALRADIDPGFEALLGSCLEKDPHARPDAADVARWLRHSESVVLEWPPPGLEELQGAAPVPVHRMYFGGLAVAAPLALLVTAVPGTPLYLEWPVSAALPALAAVGGLAWISGAAGLARLVPLISRAAKAGYPWQVLSSVLVDSSKDMGSVIAGDREYGALSPAQRDSIRKGRVAQIGLLLAGAAWSIVGVLAALPAGSRLGQAAFALTLLGVPLAALIASARLAARETTMLRPIRSRMRKHASTMDRMAGFAATWKAAFERVTSSALMARDYFRRRAIAAVATLALAAIGGITILGLTTISTLGKLALENTLPKYTNVQTKIREAERLRYLRPAPDPRITPLEAGQALNDLQAAGPMRGDRALNPPREALPRIEDFRFVKSPFGRTWLEGNGMRAAARGLTPEQRAFLEKASLHSGIRQFTTLAYAGDVDWFSAAVPQPVAENMGTLEIPVPRFSSIRVATSAQIARAILARADGRTAESERLLREVVGVGFNLIQGRTLIENLIGAVTVTGARDELVALYETSGRAAEARPIMKVTSPGTPFDPNEPGRLTYTAQEQYALAAKQIRDSLASPGLRWEFTALYAYRPCTQLREIILGPGDDYYEVLGDARRALVHNAGDEAMMRITERAMQNPLSRQLAGDGVAARSLMGFARAVDALTGSKRMTVCATLLSGQR